MHVIVICITDIDVHVVVLLLQSNINTYNFWVRG